MTDLHEVHEEALPSGKLEPIETEYDEEAPIFPTDDLPWTLRVRMVVGLWWLGRKMRIQLWFRTLLGIEREMEIVAQHVRHHQRGLDLQQEDTDVRFEVRDTRFRELAERVDRLHEMQTSRIKGLGKSVADIQKALPPNWLKSKK